MARLHAAGLVGEVGAAYLIITGILIRAGVYRAWLGRYRDTRFNAVQRCGVLARVPLGLAVLAAARVLAMPGTCLCVRRTWCQSAAADGSDDLSHAGGARTSTRYATVAMAPRTVHGK